MPDSVLLAAIVSAWAILTPSTAVAQPLDVDTPAASPLWWTLTEEISPGELRKAYRDERGHLEGYLEAVDAGLAEPLAEAQAEALSFYYHRELTPELTPMWLAFEGLASGRLLLRGEDEVRRSLREFGFSAAEAETILDAAGEQREEREALAEALAEASERFVEIMGRAIDARGGTQSDQAAVQQAAKRGELGLLQRFTDLPPDRLAELRASWLRNPTTETAAESLVELESGLDPAAWERLRRYLLEVVVPGMGRETKSFDYSKEVGR